MTRWPGLERFLATNPKDVGCDEAMAVLHIYAGIMASAEDPEVHYPGVGAHLRACGPCAEDLYGLLEAIKGPASSRHQREWARQGKTGPVGDTHLIVAPIRGPTTPRRRGARP